jgi:hypothetical protein
MNGRSLGTMSEGSESVKPVSPEKLLIDNPSNFQFHAAYLSYSEAFDKTVDPEGRKQLNENIVALQQNQIDCPTFYRNIGRYREDAGPAPRTHGRMMIKTQRKREWRRKTQKHERIQRHRK